MEFFSERIDGLLYDWLTSPTWHIDTPSENVKFYRFAAALMREAGQPDLREVHRLLEEAAREWGTDYNKRRDGRRVAVLCERLQVLYDFFSAVRGFKSPRELNPPVVVAPPSSTPTPRGSAPPCLETSLRQETSIPFEVPHSLPQANGQRGTEEPTQGYPSVQQHDPPSLASTVPTTRGGRHKEMQGEADAQEGDFPSQTRWQHFWPEVLRLHDLLLERRGEPHPPPIASDEVEAIHAEMGRRAEEVLTADEITGAEKRDLIGRVIDKVILPDKNIEGSTVTIKWLR